MAVGLQTYKAGDWNLYNVCSLHIKKFCLPEQIQFAIPYLCFKLSCHCKNVCFILKQKICTYRSY